MGNPINSEVFYKKYCSLHPCVLIIARFLNLLPEDQRVRRSGALECIAIAQTEQGNLQASHETRLKAVALSPNSDHMYFNWLPLALANSDLKTLLMCSENLARIVGDEHW